MASAVPTPSQASPPPVQTSNPASPPTKRDLKSWWKGFKLPSKHQETHEPRQQGIFGVPLRQSITYANVAISLIDENGQSYIYGYVPIVVAKCGVFLKEKATGVQGIFRLSGSEKRIKELKTIFDSPDRYGKGLVWEGYTVHDAATVFRRYLNDLPEPVVPLDLYEKFREPLRGATKQAVGDAEGPQFIENFDEGAAIERYQKLITELPPLNRQLLLYILDLLAVFAAKADENRMNSQNLAAIFQPGMLSHPTHAMAPEEYRLNQCVIIFLIENQDHFLIGMQGTATDEQTKKEIEQGPSGPITPSRKSGIGRSASNASAGADSVRRDGKIRRNRSVSSRNSKNDGSVTPNSPAVAVTPTGLGRSNTVPSKKSPAIGGSKFKKNDQPDHAHLEPLAQVHGEETRTQSDMSSLGPPVVGGAATLSPSSAAGHSHERLLDVPHEAPTPSKERNLQSLFQRSPGDGGEKRQPNKLKKKRLPGSLNPSAQSSTSSLPPHSNVASPSPGMEIANPMEQGQLLSVEERQQPPPLNPHNSDLSSEPTPRASQVPSNNNLHPDAVLRGSKSPPASVHSSFNEGSDVEPVGDETTDQAETEKKSRWRMSRSRKDEREASQTSLEPSRRDIGSNEYAEKSSTSIGSGPSRPRKSFTGDSSEPTLGSIDAQAGLDSGKEGKDETKGPIGWIRNKYREAKEEHRRNKSPSSDRQGHVSLSRGKSLDIKREPREPQEEGKQPEQVEQTQPVHATPPAEPTQPVVITEPPSEKVEDTAPANPPEAEQEKQA